MDASKIFLGALTTFNVVYGVLAWIAPSTLIAITGLDHADPSAMWAYGMCLFVVAGAIAAPILSGPKASKMVCIMSALSYGAGVPIGAIGGNHIMLIQSAVISALSAFFGFCYSFPAQDNAITENDVSTCAKIFVAVFSVLIFLDGMQAFFYPAGFRALNELGSCGPKLFQSIGLVHICASFTVAGNWISGPEAIRAYCKSGSCSIGMGIVIGAVAGNVAIVLESLLLVAPLAYFGFSRPPQQQALEQQE